jgi:hypothetical protein
MPLVLSTTGTLIWYVIWTGGMYLAPDADPEVEMTIVVVLVALYCLFGGINVAQANGRIEKIYLAASAENQKDFLVYLNARIHPIQHTLVAVCAIPLVVAIGMLHFWNWKVGAMVMFPVMFALSLCFAYAKESERRDSVLLARLDRKWQKVALEGAQATDLAVIAGGKSSKDELIA